MSQSSNSSLQSPPIGSDGEFYQLGCRTMAECLDRYRANVLSKQNLQCNTSDHLLFTNLSTLCRIVAILSSEIDELRGQLESSVISDSPPAAQPSSFK